MWIFKFPYKLEYVKKFSGIHCDSFEWFIERHVIFIINVLILYLNGLLKFCGIACNFLHCRNA